MGVAAASQPLVVPRMPMKAPAPQWGVCQCFLPSQALASCTEEDTLHDVSCGAVMQVWQTPLLPCWPWLMTVS